MSHLNYLLFVSIICAVYIPKLALISGENVGDSHRLASSGRTKSTSTDNRSVNSSVQSGGENGLVIGGDAGGSLKEFALVDIPDLEAYLFVSTINGEFHAVRKHTGDTHWMTEEEPVLRAPLNLPGSGQFMPDPRDGSLYMYKNRIEGLKKLPFTIPELVAASPSKSSDGILYTGSKKDTWYVVDPHSGFKQPLASHDDDDTEKICPSPSGKSILLGRTEYSVTMYDMQTRSKRWNVTYMDYSAHTRVGISDMSYFASCSEGVVVALDSHSADVVWVRNFHSPVVAMFLIENDVLVKLPFTILAPETLRHLAAGVSSELRRDFISGKMSNQFFPTLYIGEYEFSMYALPSIVDEQLVIRRGQNSGQLLLEGPSLDKSDKGSKSHSSSGTSLIYGFHPPPKVMIMRVPADHRLEYHTTTSKTKSDSDAGTSKRFDVISPSNSKDTALEHREHVITTTTIQIDVKLLLGFLVGVASLVLLVIYVARRQIKEVSQRFNFYVNNADMNSLSVQTSLNGPFEDSKLGKGFMRIGKIIFDTSTVLGHGCEGTIVYRGKFDGRDVAVKRLLPECYSLADREVELLRESDHNHNVIRYFCMEQDHQFRYIALELCMMSLHEYVEKRRSDEVSIKPVDVIKQAMCGLSHLHHLSIVHRDVKPQNVLITYPNSRGIVRALISDFGLCKKLEGRGSFSRRSGVAGTEGWMAPEQLNLEERTSTCMDIFSAGCVVYFVLSQGSHPFGDKIHRQSNILRGDYNLNCLDKERDAGAWDLVSSMIQYDSRRRPTVDAVLKHPFFWNAEMTLAFLSDVSDRIEKEPPECKVVCILELNAGLVVRDDWREHITSELQDDLRKFRSYRGNSVRDLLRAMRNKKHHFRECSVDVQRALGHSPEEFYNYFLSRFPLLLMHTYNSMKCCHRERVFDEYYDLKKSFDSCPDCNDLLCYIHGEFGFDSRMCCLKPVTDTRKVCVGSESRTMTDIPSNPRAEALLDRPQKSIFDNSPKKARGPRYRNHHRRTPQQGSMKNES